MTPNIPGRASDRVQLRDKTRLPNPEPLSSMFMTNEFDPAAMISRFQERAKAVQNRGIPPVEGPERRAFVERAKVDFMDYAMLGDAKAELKDGILTLTIDLRGAKD